MSELCWFVYNKGHQKSRETTREIWRSEGELTIIEEIGRSVLNNPCLNPQWLSSVLADQKLYPFGFEAIMIPKWWTVSLFYFFIINFFLRLEKNTFRGGCFSYLGTKKKSPWTWSSASLERGSGVLVGRVEVQLAPSPEKKKQQQQQQQQHRTTSTTTTIKIKKTIKTLLCSSEEKCF